jgi:hypothetical protein
MPSATMTPVRPMAHTLMPVSSTGHRRADASDRSQSALHGLEYRRRITMYLPGERTQPRPAHRPNGLE